MIVKQVKVECPRCSRVLAVRSSVDEKVAALMGDVEAFVATENEAAGRMILSRHLEECRGPRKEA